uniref:Uncharacterized protein n=1 Tax=Lepeophtheirus salmonis TaxID=72036 RepID=A0A0K2U948_LEPSM
MLCAISNLYAVPFQDSSIASRRNSRPRLDEQSGESTMRDVFQEVVNYFLDFETPSHDDLSTSSLTPSVPPNTPAVHTLPEDSQHFSYPSSNNEDRSNQSTVVPANNRRKRRRTSSVKSPANKNGFEGDDEMSDPQDEHDKLFLRLGVLSEVRKSQEMISDWSLIGVELRQIANSFEKTHPRRGRNEFKIFGLLNDIIPGSLLPSSFWSAVCSYVLWKMIHRS